MSNPLHIYMDEGSIIVAESLEDALAQWSEFFNQPRTVDSPLHLIMFQVDDDSFVDLLFPVGIDLPVLTPLMYYQTRPVAAKNGPTIVTASVTAWCAWKGRAILYVKS